MNGYNIVLPIGHILKDKYRICQVVSNTAGKVSYMATTHRDVCEITVGIKAIAGLSYRPDIKASDVWQEGGYTYYVVNASELLEQPQRDGATDKKNAQQPAIDPVTPVDKNPFQPQQTFPNGAPGFQPAPQNPLMQTRPIYDQPQQPARDSRTVPISPAQQPANPPTPMAPQRDNATKPISNVQHQNTNNATVPVSPIPVADNRTQPVLPNYGTSPRDIVRSKPKSSMRMIWIVAAIICIVVGLLAWMFLGIDNGDKVETFIAVKPDNSEVYINGSLMGKTPYKTYLKPGAYQIEVKHDGYIPLDTIVNFEPSANDRLVSKLEKKK